MSRATLLLRLGKGLGLLERYISNVSSSWLSHYIFSLPHSISGSLKSLSLTPTDPTLASTFYSFLSSCLCILFPSTFSSLNMHSSTFLGLAAFSTAVIAQASFAIPSINVGAIKTVVEQIIPTQVASLIPHVCQHCLVVNRLLLLLNLNPGDQSYQ